MITYGFEVETTYPYDFIVSFIRRYGRWFHNPHYDGDKIVEFNMKPQRMDELKPLLYLASYMDLPYCEEDEYHIPSCGNHAHLAGEIAFHELYVTRRDFIRHSYAMIPLLWKFFISDFSGWQSDRKEWAEYRDSFWFDPPVASKHATITINDDRDIKDIATLEYRICEASPLRCYIGIRLIIAAWLAGLRMHEVDHQEVLDNYYSMFDLRIKNIKYTNAPIKSVIQMPSVILSLYRRGYLTRRLAKLAWSVMVGNNRLRNISDYHLVIK